MKKTIPLFLLILFFSLQVVAQNTKNSSTIEKDPCGYYLLTSEQKEALQSTNNWGYSYSDLISDINQWKTHSFVSSEVIGKTVQNRDVFMLTFRNPESTNVQYRINIHARTHPNEVQGTYVTNEIISILLSDSELAKRLLAQCEITIIPMINPDGVELNKPRKNANDIDIESNWGSSSPQPEVLVLKNKFAEFMDSDLPINIALNMHSAYACKRYFVYHHQNGTSYDFAQKEKDFIGGIVRYFPDGMENYDYYTSWSSGTPTQYPESWFWNNYGDAVMALTYEDMNCNSAGNYDKTANAIANGIADYLELEPLSSILELASNKISVFPNPLLQGNNLKIKLGVGNERFVSLMFFDLNGKLLRKLNSTNISNAEIITFSTEFLSQGIYVLKVVTEKNSYTSKVIVN